VFAPGVTTTPNANTRHPRGAYAHPVRIGLGKSSPPRSTPNGRTHRLRNVALWTVLVVALTLSPAIWVQGVGQSTVLSSPADAPETEAALVLGAGLRPDGSPSTYLRRRLDAAASLYLDGTVPRIVVSGDGVRPGYDEPSAMRDWLVKLGVPATAIVLDREGLDTHSSCVRAHDVFDLAEAVVVTQDYHLRRALFSCREAGVDAVGIGVSAQSVKPFQAVIWHVREVPASVKAALDATRDGLASAGPSATQSR
jgi:vancomycin permeability regulator SanA